MDLEYKTINAFLDAFNDIATAMNSVAREVKNMKLEMRTLYNSPKTNVSEPGNIGETTEGSGSPEPVEVVGDSNGDGLELDKEQGVDGELDPQEPVPSTGESGDGEVDVDEGSDPVPEATEEDPDSVRVDGDSGA